MLILMVRLPACLLAIVALVGLAGLSHAQLSRDGIVEEGGSTDLTGIGLMQPTLFPGPIPTTAQPDGIELQGCGTVGVNDYTGQLFNDTSVFEKFRTQDVNSELAKQLLTYNFSMPQTAALFAQLNQFGNDRFNQFRQGCVLSAQQADARQQYVRSCMSTLAENDGAIPDSQLQPQTTGAAPITNPEELQARRTARAFDLCTQQYNATTRDLMRQSSETYAQSVRRAQDVNAMLRPLLCPANSGASAAGSGGNITPNRAASGNACWLNLFLPQVRLLAEGVKTTAPNSLANNFGVNPAPLDTATLSDGLLSTYYQFQSEYFDPFLTSVRMMRNGNRSNVELAAKEASALIDDVVAVTNPPLRDFTFGYLNCKNPNISMPIEEFGKTLVAKFGGDQQGPTQDGQALGVQRGPFASTSFNPLAERMVPNSSQLSTELQADRSDLGELLFVALGCTANQRITVFNPELTANLMSCDGEEETAFYDMAGQDLALNASQSVLGHVKQRLTLVMGRLESGDVSALRALNTNEETFDSPVIRERLATAIRTIMLPHIEQQLERLDEIEGSRGEFGKRVNQLYNDRSGCLFAGA